MCIQALSVHLHFRKHTFTCCVEMLSCSGSNIQGHFPFILKLFRAEAAFPAPLRGLQWATTPNPPGILGTFSLWFQVTTYTLWAQITGTHTTPSTVVYCTFVVCTELVLLAFPLSSRACHSTHILINWVGQQLGLTLKLAIGFKPESHSDGKYHTLKNCKWYAHSH